MKGNAWKLSTKNGLNWQEWFPVFIIIIIAILIRFYITSDKNHYLLSGADGPYFPLQVKSLLENFQLGYPDMPLLFLLGALIARILTVLHIAPESESILLAVRMIDGFLPPLAAIPVFLIAKETGLYNGEVKKSNYVMVAFSVLNFTPLVIFSYQLQKNALAVVWIFFYIYFLIRLLNQEKRSDLYKALLMLLLCTLTHFGSFGLLVLISILVFIFWLYTNYAESKMEILKKAGLVLFVMIICLSFIAFLDFNRFQKLLHIPFKIFEAPVFLYALHGQNILLNGRILFFLILFNLFSIAALLFFLLSKRNMSKINFKMGLVLVICSLILSSPMLGLEWAKRLFMVSYIPITVIYLIVFNSVRLKWFYIPSILIFSFLIAFSLIFSIMAKPFMSISSQSFLEFEQIKTKVQFQRNDAIVGRQDLRLLGSWVYGTKGISDYLLTKDAFNTFHAVYFYKQLKGKNENLRENETAIPINSTRVFEGNYFEVYRINDNTGLETEPGKIFKGVRGEIIGMAESSILVRDSRTGISKTVRLLSETKYNYLHIGQKLAIGMKVEINGEWKPFSLDIDAASINEMKNPY